jgi:hypothetical protein
MFVWGKEIPSSLWLSVCLHILPLAASMTLIILISEMFENFEKK